MQGTLDRAVLQLNARKAFIPVATAFAENTAIAFGLGKAEAIRLTLAAEEVFNHLCRVVPPDGGLVKISCSAGSYYVRLDFTFPAIDLDLRAFNITATVTVSDESDIDQMELLLASRSVDRFEASRELDQGIKLTLIKEKAYPPFDKVPVAVVKQLEEFRISAPDPAELKLFARLVAAYYKDQLLPDFFDHPGRLVDMVSGGELHASMATGVTDSIGGGILWRRIGLRAVECFGPYLFDQGADSAISLALLESCIGAIARSTAVVLINQFPTKEFPRREFEFLGATRVYAKDGTHAQREAWARLMREDLGSVVWLHPQLEAFAEREYKRLVLPREIRRTQHQGEKSSPHSVLLTTFDRLRGSVCMEPMWFGDDFEHNLTQHLNLFHHEGILDVFLILDLGQSWQTEFTPSLLKNGFIPCLILPYAGTGDLVIFQLQGTGA